MRKLLRAISLALALGAMCGLAAQAYTISVSQAYGSEFTVFNDATKAYKSYRVALETWRDLKLKPGDNLQTDAKTNLVLRVLPRGDEIRIAKNTWFRIAVLTDSGTMDFVLEYGRARAVVDKLVKTESFTVRSGATTAGVRGTDFGVEVAAVPKAGGGATTNFSVFCFEGSVVVDTFVAPASSAEGLEPVPLSLVVDAGQFVKVDALEPQAAAPAPAPIPEPQRLEWKALSAEELPSSPRPSPTPSPGAAPSPSPSPSPAAKASPTPLPKGDNTDPSGLLADASFDPATDFDESLLGLEPGPSPAKSADEAEGLLADTSFDPARDFDESLLGKEAVATTPQPSAKPSPAAVSAGAVSAGDLISAGLSLEDLALARRAIEDKDAQIVAGSVLVGLGLASQGIGYYMAQTGTVDWSGILQLGGMVGSGIGLAIIVLSLLIKPKL
jgi:hypothetical protein